MTIVSSGGERGNAKTSPAGEAIRTSSLFGVVKGTGIASGRGRFQYRWYAVAVLSRGWLILHLQTTAICIQRSVALATLDLLDDITIA
jgi:hypothetical protein